MKKPICMMYEGIKDNEKRIIIDTLVKASKIYDRKLMNLGRKPRLNSHEENIDTDMIIARSKRVVQLGAYGPRYDAEDIWYQISNSEKMKRNPFLAVFFTTKDITVKMGGRYLNFCYGYTAGNVVIISLTRIRGLEEPYKKLMIEGLIMHEIGHAFGLCLGGRSNTENNFGIHCTNPGCVMNQGLSEKELIYIFKEAFKDYHRCYCPQCMEQAKLVYN
ncbi:hypothetical protein IKG41_03275 [Candidatus Saccharibacteria bacterium]|nr:hypothetical protein [Candidatus Saccharibacteria bacterium]